MSLISSVLWAIIKSAAVAAKFIFNSKLFYLAAAAAIIVYLVRCCDAEEYFSVEDNYSKYITNLSYSFNGMASETVSAAPDGGGVNKPVGDIRVEEKRSGNIFRLDDYRAKYQNIQKSVDDGGQNVSRTEAKIISFEKYKLGIARSKFTGSVIPGGENNRSGNA